MHLMVLDSRLSRLGTFKISIPIRRPALGRRFAKIAVFLPTTAPGVTAPVRGFPVLSTYQPAIIKSHLHRAHVGGRDYRLMDEHNLAGERLHQSGILDRRTLIQWETALRRVDLSLRDSLSSLEVSTRKCGSARVQIAIYMFRCWITDDTGYELVDRLFADDLMVVWHEISRTGPWINRIRAVLHDRYIRLEGPTTFYQFAVICKDNLTGQWAQDVTTSSTFSGTVASHILTLTRSGGRANVGG